MSRTIESTMPEPAMEGSRTGYGNQASTPYTAEPPQAVKREALGSPRLQRPPETAGSPNQQPDQGNRRTGTQKPPQTRLVGNWEKRIPNLGFGKGGSGSAEAHTKDIDGVGEEIELR